MSILCGGKKTENYIGLSPNSKYISGLYTYVDPKQEIRAVEYLADKDGFHPKLNIPGSVDTPVVAAAKARHLKLFDKV